MLEQRRGRFAKQLVDYVYGPLPANRKQSDRLRGMVYDALMLYEQELEGKPIAQTETRRT